jgi:hypothetical protein
MPSPQDFARCSLYLITPPLSTLEAGTLAKTFTEILAAAPVASALLRFARGSEQEAGAIAPPFLSAAMASNCALLIESEARMAARLGADGVHVSGAGEDLVAEPQPQPFAARSLGQLLYTTPNFAKGQNAQIKVGLVLGADPCDDIRIGVRPHQFGDDIRVEKIIRQNSISRG